MDMYRVVNRETEEIYSEVLGWVKVSGKVYGHCFEKYKADWIANRFTEEGIPVNVVKDKVASRFISSLEYLSPKAYITTIIPITVIIFLAFILTVYIANHGGIEQLTDLIRTKYLVE